MDYLLFTICLTSLYSTCGLLTRADRVFPTHMCTGAHPIHRSWHTVYDLELYMLICIIFFGSIMYNDKDIEYHNVKTLKSNMYAKYLYTRIEKKYISFYFNNINYWVPKYSALRIKLMSKFILWKSPTERQSHEEEKIPTLELRFPTGADTNIMIHSHVEPLTEYPQLTMMPGMH